MRKQATKVTEANDGMHSQKAFHKAKMMLVNHGFSSPRLYHLILLDHIEATTAHRFQSALKALCRKLSQSGIENQWRACVERDDEKGLHFHVFLLVEARKVNPCSIINTKTDGWLRKMLDSQPMHFHLSPPKARIHRTGDGHSKNYAAVVAGEKLDDCIEWISYLTKVRSKPVDMSPIYFSSRNRRPTPVIENRQE